MNVLLEYLIIFIIVWIINYFMTIPNYKKEDKKKVRKKGNSKEASVSKVIPELVYLEKIYHIHIKKINKSKFLYLSVSTNTFIISTIYIILMYLISNWIIKIILGIILLILMIIICYGLIGRYYLKIEGKE